MARIPFRVTDMRVWGVLSPSTGDTQAPSIPANVVATAINAGRVDLTWTASTDDFGVTGYQIFRNGTPLSTSTLTSYSDTTCQPSTAYSYVIVAYDAAGNNSAASSAGLATTPANAAPVWQSIPAQVPIVGNSYLLQFADYCTDADLDTLTFSVPPETLPSGIVLSGNRLQGTPTTAGQTPTITVRAADAFHTIDTTIAFSTKTADVTAPPVPTGVSASAVGSSQIDVSWTASTDAAGSADELVSGTQDYRVYRSIDGTNYSLRTTVTGTSYSDTGLSASTPYWYKVASRDVALNESAQSAAQSATTSAPSTFAPLRTINFDGLSNGASVDSVTGTPGKRFDFWGTFAAGFGSQASTAIKRTGKTSSCAMSIEAGSDGGLGGGTGPNGSFGGGFITDVSHQASEGEWIHAGMWIYFPVGWSNRTNTAHLKFWRWQRTGSGSKTEMHWLDGSWTWAQQAGISGEIVGIAAIVEGADGTEIQTHHVCDRRPTLGQWNYLEVAVLAHSVAANSGWRIWINNQFVFERIGLAEKWYGRKYNNLGGAPGFQTQTLTTAIPTLTSASQMLSSPMFCTYWNGGPTQTQTMYLDSVCWAKDVASMTVTDEFGNKMMGSAVLP